MADGDRPSYGGQEARGVPRGLSSGAGSGLRDQTRREHEGRGEWVPKIWRERIVAIPIRREPCFPFEDGQGGSTYTCRQARHLRLWAELIFSRIYGKSRLPGMRVDRFLATMRSDPNPPCPKCGSADCEKVSERLVDAENSFFEQRPGAPHEIIFVFRCPCGVSFTHSVRSDDDEALIDRSP